MSRSTATALPAASKSEARRVLDQDVAALHAMWAARPLRPPPYRFDRTIISPAVYAAREDRRRGIL
jgi:hypothetical protein